MGKASASLKRHIELDFVRGIALLMVMVYHFHGHDRLITWDPWRTMASGGWAGVDLFFVLSGFLVGGLLMREWKSTGSIDGWRFLKRRAFKIWPSYYTFILVAAVFHVHPLRTFLWQSLLNVQNYYITSMGHTWSLAVEEHFYLGAAAFLGLWAAARWNHRALIAVCLAVAFVVEVARAHAARHGILYYPYTHMRIDALLLGVVLAALQQFEPKLFHRLREFWPVWMICVVLALAELYNHPVWDYSPWVVTAVDWGSAAALLWLSRPGGDRQRSLPYRAVARLGIFSYGVYLWHISVLRPVDWVVRHTPGVAAERAVSTLLPYVLAIAIGVIMTRAVELPALRLRERLVPPKTPEPRIPTVA